MLKDKLKTVIKAIDGTNVKISEYAGMAAPNIGKLTNGSRVPARQSSTAHKLGYGIYGFCEANGKLDILSEKTVFYTGTSGLQRAVIRFLGNAAKKPGSELLLYSDQSMEWMQQARFIPKWQSLMRECLKNGVKIKIIHNIDRDPSEMLFALRSWLPLYMTGLIESYYRPDTSGSRFCHTVFISGDDCIDGFCTVGMERDCVYRYSSDGEYIGHIRRSYDKLTHSIKPLVRFERGTFEPQREYEVFDCGDVRIYISYKEVVVFKTSAPQCSFVLKHHYLIQIFSLYARSFGQKMTA